MFSGLDVAVENPARRWTALVSFALQATIVAVALVYPLLNPQSLPRIMRPVWVPASRGEIAPRPTPSRPSQRSVPAQHTIVVNQHRFTFHRIADLEPRSEPSPPGFTPEPGPSGNREGVWNVPLSTFATPVPVPVPVRRPPRMSVIMEGNLITRIQPKYPVIARQIGLQGTVIVKAIISREGNIEKAVPVSGPPLLAPAAIQAVEQWKYRPYYLNGEPIEVETQITVHFVLAR